MMEIIKKIFGSRANKPQKEFSAFFNYASRKEKINLLEEVVRKANEDQRRLVAEVKKSHS